MKYADFASNLDAYANASLNAAMTVNVITVVVAASFPLVVRTNHFVIVYSMEHC